MTAPIHSGPAAANDHSRPAPLSQDESILELLTKTRRKVIPMRKTYVQQGHGKTTRPGPLAEFVTHHDERGLDAYLLVHAIASAAAPHTAIMHAGAWARLLGLGDTATAESAKSAVSKVMRRLEQRQLVTRSRRKRTAVVTLLREDGSGEEFERPQARTCEDRWLQLPHAYWTGGAYQNLQLPGKAMLLISLSRPDGFPMPEQQAAHWYGLSPSTIGGGLRELEQIGILHRDWEWVRTVKSETGWTQEHRFTLIGEYATNARKKAAKSRYGDPDTTTEDSEVNDEIEAALDEIAGENP